MHNKEFFSDLRSLSKPVWGDVLAWPVTLGDISISLTKDNFRFVNCEITAQTLLCNVYTCGGRKRKIVGLG